MFCLLAPGQLKAHANKRAAEQDTGSITTYVVLCPHPKQNSKLKSRDIGCVNRKLSNCMSGQFQARGVTVWKPEQEGHVQGTASSSPSVRQPGTDDQITSQGMPVQLDCTSSDGADKQGCELEIHCVSRTHVTHPPPCRLLEAVQKKGDCELELRAGFLGTGICLRPALCSRTLVLWALVRPGLSSSLNSGMSCNYCCFCTAQDVATQQPARDPKGLKGGPPPCFASACMRNEEMLHFLFAACLRK